MSGRFLGDGLGPRWRRQSRILSVISVALILGFIYVALSRLADKGQLDGLMDQAAYKKFVEGLH